MTIHITEIQKHKFICGLFWQSLSRPRELKKEAVTLAKKINFDLMVLRKDYLTVQAGFAQSKEGTRRAVVYSLAAAVSQTVMREGAIYDGQRQRVQNWLGAFKLPDGKWVYFAVRDANFLPNGDFAGTKEEVLERLQGDYGLGGWSAVIGDAELEEYGFHNFNAKRIDELLPRDSRGVIKMEPAWTLRPVVRKLPPTVLLAGVVTLLLVVGGLLFYQYTVKKKEEERERALAAVRKQLQMSPAQTETTPWSTKPLPQALVKTCLERFTHLTPGGWMLDEFACTPTELQYTWSRQDSAIDFLLEQVPDANIELNGNKATYSQPISGLETASEAILKEKELLEPMLSVMQLMNLKLNIFKVKSPGSQTVLASVSPQAPPWHAYNLSVTLDGVSPVEAANLFNRPGVRINRLAYRGNTWTIEGVAYAK